MGWAEFKLKKHEGKTLRNGVRVSLSVQGCKLVKPHNLYGFFLSLGFSNCGFFSNTDHNMNPKGLV